jgi:YVTN family beta-propeller protein
MRLQPTITFALVALALAVVGCQAPATFGGVRLGIEAVTTGPLATPTGPSSLTVQLDAATLRKLSDGGRTLQALVSDISYVTVTVQPSGFAEVSQVIQKAQLASGNGTATFNNLPAVATVVRISAFDATAKLIGSGTQKVTVVTGTPTSVSFAIPLDPTYIAATGVVNTTISFSDGPVVAGPPKNATPTGTVLQTLLTDGTPEWIAFDKKGNAWIPSFTSSKIDRFDMAGTPLATVIDGLPPPALPTDPSAVAFDAAGNAWVANYAAGAVASFSSAGKALVTLPIGLYPTALAFDAKGKLWVVNYFGNNVVIIDVVTGKPAGTFKVGTNPIGITFDGSGNAYILGLKSQDVTKVSPLGVPLAKYKTGDAPQGMALDPSGNLWVSNSASNTLMKFDPQGVLTGTFKTGRRPRGVAIDKNGAVWVANNQDSTVTKFTPGGIALGTFAVGAGPRNLAFDSGGTLWVANYDGGSVMMIAP